jgi:TPR repeat protein
MQQRIIMPLPACFFQPRQRILDAQCNFGVWLMHEKKYPDALPWLEKASRQGHEDALLHLAECEKQIRLSQVDAAEEEEAPPKCFICGKPITEEMQWASTAKTPDGLRHYCSRTCGMKDTLDIIFG